MIHIPKYRYNIARFRLSSHDLAIELGRHTKPKTPVEDRVCNYSCNVTENEMHVLLVCPMYSTAREVLINLACKYVNNFLELSIENKFCAILACQEPDILYALGRLSGNS